MKLLESEGNTPAITKIPPKDTSFPVLKFEVLFVLFFLISRNSMCLATLGFKNLYMATSCGLALFKVCVCVCKLQTFRFSIAKLNWAHLNSTVNCLFDIYLHVVMF